MYSLDLTKNGFVHAMRPAIRSQSACNEEITLKGVEAKVHYRRFIPGGLAEGTPENSLNVSEMTIAEVRGADDKVVARHTVQ